MAANSLEWFSAETIAEGRTARPPYLHDEHARGHGEPRAGGKVAGDHEAHAGLREGQLVGVGRQELIHHQHGGPTVEVSCSGGGGYN